MDLRLKIDFPGCNERSPRISGELYGRIYNPLESRIVPADAQSPGQVPRPCVSTKRLGRHSLCARQSA
eukprot:22752_4